MPDPITIKPWGRELLLTCNDNYAAKIILIKLGHRLSLQYHELKRETLYFVYGLAEVILGEQTILAAAGTIIEIPPKMKHRITAVKDVMIFEVSTPELDDVIRLEDDYGRTD